MLIDTSINSASTLNEVEWVDTHAHLNFPAFKDDASEVIRRSLDNGVWLINVGSQYTTSKRAVEIAEKYEQGVYAAIGLHPIYARDEFDYQRYKKLTDSKKVVAIGEIGLDYKKEYASFKEKQRTVLCKQLNLAEELGLPVIFHCRMAHQDLLEILLKFQHINKSTGVDLLIKGVIHCFTGNWKQAEEYLEMGFYLGFNGIIFKLDLDEIIKKVPLERILIETDCPYLTPPISVNQFTPTPNFGVGASNQHKSAFIRNEPLYLKYIAKKISELKNTTFEEITKITFQNAKNLFKIG